MAKNRFFDTNNESSKKYRLLMTDEFGYVQKAQLQLFGDDLDNEQISQIETEDGEPLDTGFPEFFSEDSDEASRPVGKWAPGLHLVPDYSAYRGRPENRTSASNDAYVQCWKCRRFYGFEGSEHCECRKCHNVHDAK